MAAPKALSSVIAAAIPCETGQTPHILCVMCWASPGGRFTRDRFKAAEQGAGGPGLNDLSVFNADFYLQMSLQPGYGIDCNRCHFISSL